MREALGRSPTSTRAEGAHHPWALDSARIVALKNHDVPLRTCKIDELLQAWRWHIEQSQHFDVANTCGGTLEKDPAQALQNCSSELKPHDAANVLHRVTDLGCMRNALATSLLRSMVQNATSAIVATGSCCVCPPITMMSNIPRATFGFAWRASLVTKF